MSKTLRRLLGDPSGGDAAAGLRARLKDYPPYTAPHVGGSGRELSKEAARENLAYFEAVRTQRLAAIQTLLRDDAAIDAHPALEAPLAHGPAFADELAAWATSRWPALHDPHLATLSAWLHSHRAGADIVLSVVLDVAIVLGELVVRGNPAWRWDLDGDATNLRANMTSARRVVLIADPVGEHSHPFVMDIEALVVGRYQHPSDMQYTLGNPWRAAVEDGLSGAELAFWRGT